MNLGDVVDGIIRSPSQPKFYARILDDHVIGERCPAREFRSGKHYFEIRLTEMYLRDKREYWRTFVPMAVALTEFLYDGKSESVPFLISNALLRQIQNVVNADGLAVEMRNTRIAGPIPYAGGDVVLFVGLFRSQVADLSETLWKLLEEVVTVFDVTQLSRYIDIARPLQTGFAKLLGLKEVEFRAGMRAAFTAVESLENPGSPRHSVSSDFREGYWIYGNCPESTLSTRELWVKDGLLLAGPSLEDSQRLRSCDHCLVKIEQVLQRNDYTAFGFHRRWEEVQREIYKNTKESRTRATRLLLEVCAEIARCPDITQEQRYQLILAYKANFEVDSAVVRGRPNSAPGSQSKRGLTISATARDTLNSTALTAAEAGMPRSATEGLIELGKLWDTLPGLQRSSEMVPVPLSEDLLQKQLEALATSSRTTRGDPATLVEALTIAAFSSGASIIDLH